MPPLILKLAPWAIAALAVVGAVKLYGDKRSAEGAMRAHIETADRLQAQYVADSTANAAQSKVIADSIVTLNKAITVAVVQRQVARRQADSTATELRATLTTEQAAQLDALTAAHQRERDTWAAEQQAAAAKLALMTEERDAARHESADLRQINASLRAATEGCAPGAKASFVQKASPYILGVLAVAKGVDLVVRR